MANPRAAVVVVLPVVNGQLPVVSIRNYHRFKQLIPVTAWQAVERLKAPSVAELEQTAAFTIHLIVAPLQALAPVPFFRHYQSVRAISRDNDVLLLEHARHVVQMRGRRRVLASKGS